MIVAPDVQISAPTAPAGVQILFSHTGSEVKVANLYKFLCAEREYDKTVNCLYFRRSGVGPNLCNSGL